MREFEICGGSVMGADHIMIGKPGSKNNQDAFAWRMNAKFLSAIVCDGCSGGKFSEVGAQITAQITAQAVWELANIFSFGSPDARCAPEWFWRKLKQKILNSLSRLAEEIGFSLSGTVNDFFLFSIVGCLLAEEKSYLFSIGDGVYRVNGELKNLGPFPGNSPPYIAYSLTGSQLEHHSPELLDFQITEITTADLDNLIIGTDGVLDLVKLADQSLPRKTEVIGGLEQFLEDKYFQNPDNIRRRLNVINKEDVADGRLRPGPLKDDTTVIAIRRKNTVVFS
jgi:serine/threonine protein phosphatase PrpC